jgi:hypothetical protein
MKTCLLKSETLPYDVEGMILTHGSFGNPIPRLSWLERLLLHNPSYLKQPLQPSTLLLMTC